MQTGVAIDLETVPFGPGNKAPDIVCLSYYAGHDYTDTMSRDKAKTFLENSLRREVLIGANIAYDMSCALSNYPELCNSIFDCYEQYGIRDVLINQKLIDIAAGEYRCHGPYSLANLAKRLLGEHVEKKDTYRMRFAELKNIPINEWPKEAKEYAQKDARITYEIYKHQIDELTKINMLEILKDSHAQCRADFALTLASAWGMYTDEKSTKKMRTHCETELARLRKILIDKKLLRFTKKGLVRNTRYAQSLMQKSVEKYKLTKKGKELFDAGNEKWKEVKYVSVDEEACRDSNDPTLTSYSEYVTIQNLISGHVEMAEKGFATPIHTDFEILLETGRTASSKPNLQNIRRAEGARECFTPAHGNVFVGCDIDKAELHTLAQICIRLFRKSRLADVLNQGYDPHTGLGARLAGISYEQAVERLKNEDEQIATWRQRAKAGNFGFPGGMGPGGMVRYAKSTYGVIMSFDVATRLHEKWKEEYPEVGYDYLKWIRDLTEQGNAMIKHFVSNRYRGNVPYCTAANSFFQGLSADAMKSALWEVQKKCFNLPSSSLYGSHVVNLVHDEIILECEEEKAHEVAIEMRQTIVDAYNQYTPDVPVRSTPVVMDRWSKRAKSKIGADGRLTVWRYTP